MENDQKNVISHFFLYLKNPLYIEKKKYNLFYALKCILIFLLIEFLLEVIFGYINLGLIKLGLYEKFEHILFNYTQTLSYPEKANTIFSILFFAPILEEAVFRLPLKFKNKYLIISASIFVGGVILSFFSYNLSFFRFYIYITLFSFLFSILIFPIFKGFNYKQYEPVWKNNFKYIYYGQALAFGLIHISSYGLSGNQTLFSIVILAPVIGTGLVLGYLRMRFGTLWAIFYHFLTLLFTIV